MSASYLLQKIVLYTQCLQCGPWYLLPDEYEILAGITNARPWYLKASCGYSHFCIVEFHEHQVLPLHTITILMTIRNVQWTMSSLSCLAHCYNHDDNSECPMDYELSVVSLHTVTLLMTFGTPNEL